MPILSLCMIVKNEEQFLEQCLNSVNGLVDEIVIVDTGSTDGSKEIAKKFTDKLYDFEWCDDFSAARNESLKHATGDWILVLDADETISEKDHAKIKELIYKSDSEVVGYELVQRHYSNSSHLANWVSSVGDDYQESKVARGFCPNPITRLFRMLPLAKFQGAVHENIYYILQKAGKVVATQLPIHHYGHLDEGKKVKKSETYEKIAAKKAEKDNHFFSYCELAKEQIEQEKFEEAITAAEKSISLKDDYYESWFLLGNCHFRKGDIEKAKKALVKARTLNYDYGPAHGALGVCFYKSGDYAQAVPHFVKAILINELDAESYLNLGFCLDHLGKKGMAYLALKKAVGINSSFSKYVEIGRLH